MDINIEDNNDVVINALEIDIASLSVEIVGKDNVVIIKEKSICNKLSIKIIGNNNFVLIDNSVIFRGTSKINIYDDNNNVSIGNNSFFEGSINILVREGTKLSIGKDCLFSWGIDIRTSDQHSIIDNLTGNRVNTSKDIVIGDHIWVGSNVTILKGSIIKSNSVIGTKSIVNKPYKEENVIIAGIPSKIRKHNINWTRERK